jgi:hypothetical protein
MTMVHKYKPKSFGKKISFGDILKKMKLSESNTQKVKMISGKQTKIQKYFKPTKQGPDN